MAAFNTYFYHGQLRKYLVQFMAIFADMHVQVGWNDDTEPKLIKVPIKNASSDRLVADIFSENTQNKPVRLPLMTARLRNLNLAPERRHGVGTSIRQTYLPVGGLAPNDITVATTRMPVQYIANFELEMWVSNQDQHYQLLEQILTIFEPLLELQTSDDVLDITRISSVELTNIDITEDVAGTERRVLRTTLTFDVPVFLTIPTIKRQQIVENIFVRVAAVSQETDFTSSADIVAAAEATGLDYEHWFSADDLDFPQDN